MNNISEINKKFLEFCKNHQKESKKFWETASNFLSLHQKISFEKTNTLLNSASVIINAEKVTEFTELNTKQQKLSTESIALKKKISDNLKIKNLYEKLTNFSINNKIIENNEICTGVLNIQGYPSKIEGLDTSKAMIFKIFKKKVKNIEKWKIMIENVDGNLEKLTEIQGFYKECLRLFPG